jgi:hypothetical protein
VHLSVSAVVHRITAPEDTKAATVERIEVGTARNNVTSAQALLVCAYEDDAKCRKGRLEGSIPFARFETMAATLPKTQEIIFYCS